MANERSVSIRFPIDLHAKLKDMAKIENRSFNKEVIQIISEYLQNNFPNEAIIEQEEREKKRKMWKPMLGNIHYWLSVHRTKRNISDSLNIKGEKPENIIPFWRE